MNKASKRLWICLALTLLLTACGETAAPPAAEDEGPTVNYEDYIQSVTDRKITDKAIDYIKEEEPDFLFLYLGDTDEAGGHDNGWMSDIYLQVVNKAIGCIEKVYRNLPEGYTMIVIADHGGHDRSHGTDMPEDMTIPVCICGPKFEEGREMTGTSILDIAPTVTKLLEVPRVKEWEGKELV